MPRKPLPIGTWGRISRTQVDVGRWVARARFRDDDGVTRKVEAWGKTGAAAERALLVAMTQRAASGGSELTPESRMSYLADYWLRTEVDDSKRAINTRTRYRDVVQTHVIPGVGGLLVREATVGALDRFLKRVAAETGAPTAKLCKTILSGMMALAVREGAAPANTARDVSPIEAAHKEVRALTADEVRALRFTLASDEAAASVCLPQIVDMMLATGARIGEVLALRWQDVDLVDGTISLNATMVRDTDGLVRQDTTKGRKVRRLLLPDFAVDLLRARAAEGIWGSGAQPVFPSATGTFREVSTVDKQWRKFRERHDEWSWVSPHTFRKTVGTAIERSTGLAAAASQLGHTTEAITRRHYVETPDLAPDQRAVLEALTG